MRGRPRNKRDYTLATAQAELAEGVHFGVVAARMGITEADLAVRLDLLDNPSRFDGALSRWIEGPQ